MRWTAKSTWFRIAMLFDIYPLVPATWFSLSRVSDSVEIVKSLIFLTLLVILPILAMGFGVWGGVKEGLSLLWLLAPFVCFLALMYLLLNDDILIYGVGYSLLDSGTHCVSASIRVCSSRWMWVCNGPIRAPKVTTRICPRAQVPLHSSVAFLGVVLPVLRRLKTRAVHKHAEELARFGTELPRSTTSRSTRSTGGCTTG